MSQSTVDIMDGQWTYLDRQWTNLDGQWTVPKHSDLDQPGKYMQMCTVTVSGSFAKSSNQCVIASIVNDGWTVDKSGQTVDKAGWTVDKPTRV